MKIKRFLYAAAAFCCMMTANLSLTSCSDVEDNPTPPTELQLALAPDCETNVILKDIMFGQGTFSLKFIANDPTAEITVDDFTFEVEEEPIEIGSSHSLPGDDWDTELKLRKVEYFDGIWWTDFTYYAPANTAGLSAVVKVMFRGTQVATVNVSYNKPYEVAIDTRDGYLYPGETYTAYLLDYATNKPYEGLWFLAISAFSVNGVYPVDFHTKDYDLGEGDYDIVIPEDFPFSDEEKEQGYATIALSGKNVVTLFRVRYQEPLKAVATSWNYSFSVEPLEEYEDDNLNLVDTYIISPTNQNNPDETNCHFEYTDFMMTKNTLTMFPAEGTISLKLTLKDQYPAKDSYSLGYKYKLIIQSLSADGEVVDTWSQEAKTEITIGSYNLENKFPRSLDFNYYIDKVGRVSVETKDWRRIK